MATHFILAQVNTRAYFEYVQSDRIVADGLSDLARTIPDWALSNANLPDLEALRQLDLPEHSDAFWEQRQN